MLNYTLRAAWDDWDMGSAETLSEHPHGDVWEQYTSQSWSSSTPPWVAAPWCPIESLEVSWGAGSTTMQETFKGWEMPKKRPSLGVAMVGDQLFTLIPASATVPCMAKQVRPPHGSQPKS